MIPVLDAETLAARYDLLARATDPLPSDPADRARHDGLGRLNALVQTELLALARQASPDDFADIHREFLQELERFAAFCAYPALSQRALVAFGGGFSAGKSSLINALMGQRVLPVEIDPTTTLPAYVLGGEANRVLALNHYAQRIALSDAEFASLTHDEYEEFGTQIGRLLHSAFVVRQEFAWPQLAFVDTPGFQAGAEAAGEDAARALARLEAAQAVVWVSPIKQGTLNEDDLAILARLRPEQPKIVVLSHADQVTEDDRARILAQVEGVLAARNLLVEGVYAVSRHPRYRDLLARVHRHLEGWASLAQEARFAHRFKALCVRYARGLEAEKAAAERERHFIDRLLALVPEAAVAEALPLKAAAQGRIDRCAGVLEGLTQWRGRFFTALSGVGKALGMALPEPDEMELIDIGGEPRLREVFAAVGKGRNRKPETGLSTMAALMTPPKAHAAHLEQRRLNPLPDHAFSRAADHLRRQYGQVLAAVLSAQDAVSESQSRLLLLLLESLKVGDARAAFFEAVREWDEAALTEALRLLREGKAATAVLTDALALLRLDAPLSEPMAGVVADMARFLQVTEHVNTLPKVGRNDLCPCGSGKKYKHCHGRLA
jgi:GTP-binding protein EngB required for normal cell division